MSNAIATLSYMLAIDTKQFTQGVVATRKDVSDLKRMLGDTATAEEELASKLERINELRAKFTTVPEERWARAIEAVQRQYEETKAAQTGAMQGRGGALAGGAAFAKGTAIDAAGLGGVESALATGGPLAAALAAGMMASAKATDLLVGSMQALSGVALDSIGRLDDMADSAQALGISASSLQRLETAAMLADAPAEQLVQALYKLEDILGGEVTDQAAARFDKLGLSMAELQAMQPDQAFLKVAAAIDQLPNKAQQIAAMRDVFGKVDVTLLNLIDDAEKFVAQADKMTLADSQFEAIGQADIELKRLSGKLTHVKDLIGAEMAPAVADLAGVMADFLGDAATKDALRTTLVVVRDTLREVAELSQTINQADPLGKLATGGKLAAGATGLGGLVQGLDALIVKPSQAKAAAEETARQIEKQVKLLGDLANASAAGGMGGGITAKQAEAEAAAFEKQLEAEEKRAGEFFTKLAEMRDEVSTFGDKDAALRRDAQRLGAVQEFEIEAYVELRKALEEAKQAEDALRKSQADRAQQQAKNAADLARMSDSLLSPLEKAQSELDKFRQLGATGGQLDAMADKLAGGLMPKQVNQAPIVGIEKGSREAIALEAASNREDRQLVVLKDMRKALQDQLKKEAIEVREMVF